ncbi:MAG: sigma-70 family RNA polymerase sigma factor [Acidobacteria bacterium]|nr:sigma-70 family RNA polymerase sigma factor [Acidobacteriota bacterium]
MNATSSSFDSLYSSLNDKLIRAAFRILRQSSAVDAEDAALDVVQSVWLRISELIQAGREDAKDEPFIMAATVNRARNYRRDAQLKAKVICASLDAPARLDGDITTVGDILCTPMPRPTDPRLAQIRIAMDSLPESLRTILSRTYFDGWSTQEIAFDMGLTVQAVRQRLTRGRAAIQDIISGNQQKVAA